MTPTERIRLLRERGVDGEFPDNREGRRARARTARKHRKASK